MYLLSVSGEKELGTRLKEPMVLGEIFHLLISKCNIKSGWHSPLKDHFNGLEFRQIYSGP